RDDYQLRLSLAAAHWQCKQTDLALADFHAARAINPYLVTSWYMEGLLLNETSRPAEAVAPLKQALKLAPSNADAHYQLGLALMRSGRGADAFEPLMTAAKLAPGSPEPLSHLSWLLATHPDA